MATENRILWTRPEGCLCGAELTGTKKGETPTLLRKVDPACSQHGARTDALDAAVEAAEAVIRTVPGVKLSSVQVRRLVLAALPVLQAAIAAGQLPAAPPKA